MNSSHEQEPVVPFSQWQIFWGRYSFALDTPLSIPECFHQFRHHLRFEYETSGGLAFGLAFTTRYKDINETDATFHIELASVPLPIVGVRAIGRCYHTDETTSIVFEVRNLPGNYWYVFIPAVFLLISFPVGLAFFPLGMFFFLGMLIYFISATVYYMDQQRKFRLSLLESIRATLDLGADRQHDS
jgi:hypothetical protein